MTLEPCYFEFLKFDIQLSDKYLQRLILSCNPVFLDLISSSSTSRALVSITLALVPLEMGSGLDWGLGWVALGIIPLPLRACSALAFNNEEFDLDFKAGI